MSKNSKENKKRRSRYERSEKPTPIQLQPRDKQLLACIYEYRYLTAKLIKDLLFLNKSYKIMSVRLQKLWQNGYLDRIFIPVILRENGAPKKSPPQPIYMLTQKGLTEVANFFGLPKHALKYTPLKKHHQYSFVAHNIKAAEFKVGLTVACRESDALQLAHWLTENELRKLIRKNKAARREERKDFSTPIADGFFSIERTLDDYGHFFLEIDMAQEDLGRIEKKIRNYIGFFKEELHKSLFGIPHFRVLFVTTSEKRVEHMKEIVRKINLCPNMFWFTTFADENDKSNLNHLTITKPIWQLAQSDMKLALGD